MIDSSFFGVYTDPSKPPVIGDLAGLKEGPAGSAAVILPAVWGRFIERSGSIKVTNAAYPTVAFQLTHKGFGGAS